MISDRSLRQTLPGLLPICLFRRLQLLSWLGALQRGICFGHLGTKLTDAPVLHPQISGSFKVDGSGNVDFVEEDGIDYAAVTVQVRLLREI